MKGKRIHHVGIAVNSIDRLLPFYRDSLGMEFLGFEEDREVQKLRVALFALGESRIELLEPTGPDSALSKFLEKRGEGMHHIAYEVEDLEGAMEKLSGEGYTFLSRHSGRGARGTKIVFLDPKETGGILTELCQREEGCDETRFGEDDS